MKKFNAFAAAAVVAASLSAGPVAAADQVKMMFDWIPGGLSGSWYAGRANGCFTDRDLEFSFDRGSGGVDTVAKVAAGVGDIGMADLGTVMLGIDRNGAAIRAIVPLYSDNPFGVMTIGSTGINTLKDLEGRKLASGPGDSAILFLPLAMENAGADFSAVNTEKADFSALLGLLLQGKIDAHTTFLTTGRILGAVIEKTGKEPVFIHYGKDLEMYGSVIFAREEFLKSRPDVAKRTIEAIQCAYSAAKDNPDAIADALLAEFPEKKRGAEMASILGGLEMIFETETYKSFGFDWDMARVAHTYENTAASQGADASSDPASFVYTPD